MAHLIIKVREIQRRVTKIMLVQITHLCVLVPRESHLQRIGDALGKGMINAFSRKADTSCISLYLSFVCPMLLLVWDPWRFFGSLYSFGFISSAGAAAKEKTRFIPAAKAYWVMGVYYAIKRAKHFLVLGQKTKRNNYWRRIYRRESEYR